MKAEKIAAGLIQNYQLQIQRQKDLIIYKLSSSEETLVKNIKQNPKLWNSKCLKVKLEAEKPDCQNDALSAVITVNRPDARNYAETVKFREQDESIDLTDKVR